MSKLLYLSYFIDKNTPTYGNRNKIEIMKKSSIQNGDIANDSCIKTTVHIGTHLDMPYHFFEQGQTIEDFEINYFYFKNVLFFEIHPNSLVIKEELIQELEKTTDKEKYEFLIVKTGICYKRNKEDFWKKNYGFDPSVADYIRSNFPNIRVMGFDSISVSSFAYRMIGREAHKAFLNPQKPILLLEDMDLTQLNQNRVPSQVTVVPLRIAKCDGLPCTVMAEVENID